MITPFSKRLDETCPECGHFDSLQTIQVNLGNRCNLACAHCHVEATPTGERIMDRDTVDRVVAALRRCPSVTLDLTGGAAEMHPDFRRLVESTLFLPRRILRSNLAIMVEKGFEWLPTFCREQGLVVVGSLPCYLEENVDAQRGEGVFRRCIEALRRLNAQGYGTELELDLVYNPGGEFLPPSQQMLEEAYRRELSQRYGIVFSHLFTITNLPVGRFAARLTRNGTAETYLKMLATRFNPATVTSIMCRTLVSVDHRGILYNCDFNQMLGIPFAGPDGAPLTVDSLGHVPLEGLRIRLGQHCYGCTAGGGSSCTGALAA